MAITVYGLIRDENITSLYLSYKNLIEIHENINNFTNLLSLFS